MTEAQARDRGYTFPHLNNKERQIEYGVWNWREARWIHMPFFATKEAALQWLAAALVNLPAEQGEQPCPNSKP